MTATMDRPTTGQVEALRRIGVDVPDGITRDEAGRKLADAVQAARKIDPARVDPLPLTPEQTARVESWWSSCPVCAEPMSRSSDHGMAGCFNLDCPNPPTIMFNRPRARA